jgi:hypothetical protein
MRHALIEKSSPEQLAAADEAADWMLDALATSTQDRRYLRGDTKYDDNHGRAIIANAKIACLRAIHKVT